MGCVFKKKDVERIPFFNDPLSVCGEETSASRMLFHACKVCTIVSLTGFTYFKVFRPVKRIFHIDQALF
jgi:hypothetical protein